MFREVLKLKRKWNADVKGFEVTMKCVNYKFNTPNMTYSYFCHFPSFSLSLSSFLGRIVSIYMHTDRNVHMPIDINRQRTQPPASLKWNCDNMFIFCVLSVAKFELILTQCRADGSYFNTRCLSNNDSVLLLHFYINY